MRIAGWAGNAEDAHLPSVTKIGPLAQLDTYGRVIEISAIVESGQRSGVDMVWGARRYVVILVLI